MLSSNHFGHRINAALRARGLIEFLPQNLLLLVVVCLAVTEVMDVLSVYLFYLSVVGGWD
jgi:hypothetical protein